METELKIAAIRTGKNQYEIAQELGWHPSKFSQIISGYQSPSSDERQQLAQYFGASVRELFPIASKTEPPT